MKKNEKSETIQLLVKRRNSGYLVVKIERN
jgi:hypothetical protein